MKKKLLSLLALVMLTMTASAVDAPTFTLTKGENAYGTMTFKVNNAEVTTAKEGDQVTVTVEPNTGYIVGTVSGYWDAAGAASRSAVPFEMLDQFTPAAAGTNTWTFTMQRANATVSVSYRKTLQASMVQTIASPTYNGSAQTPAVTLKDGDKTLVLNQDYTVKYSNNKNAGTATATITGIGDYTGTLKKTFTIQRKSVKVTGGITASNKVYDGTTTATVDCGAATISGTLGGDKLTVSGVTGTFDNKNVGTGKTVKLSYTNAMLGGSGALNYKLASSGNQSSATADITKRTVTVSGVKVSSKTYDGTKTATVSLSNVVLNGKADGDDLTVSGITATFDNKNAATGRTATLSYSKAMLGGSDALNYQLASSGNQSSAKADILQKTLYVTANSKTINYGDAPSNNGVTYSGFISTEGTSVLEGTLKYAYNSLSNGTGSSYKAGSPAGSYYIIPSGQSAANYNIIYRIGVLTVLAGVGIIRVDGDSSGVVDGADLDAFIDNFLNNRFPTDKTSASFIRHDANQDGRIDVADAQAILNLSMGLNADGSLKQ